MPIRLLAHYFGEEKAASMLTRIEVVEGDLTEDFFGLSEEAYQQLCASVKAVYHCAADVRHYAADESTHLKVNVGGTERMIRLALDADAELFHMSTCSVSGDVMKDGTKSVIFTENDLDIGQIWERNVYVRTKFVAEERVKEAMEKGLRAKIFRLGRLVGRTEDGKFQMNPESNAFYLFLKGIEQLGIISEKAAEITLDVMPVDLAAKQVWALRNGSESVYHIMNSEPPVFAEILGATERDVSVANDEVFKQTLCAKMLEMDRERMALVMNNWLQLDAVRDGIIVTNNITQEALRKVGFAAPAFSLSTVLNEFKKGNDE